MTLTTPILPPPRLSAIPCCPNCGTDLSLTFTGASPSPNNKSDATLQAAQAQIDDLQAQIRLLNAKATAAVDRWADYEDELSKLRKELSAAKDAPRRESMPQTPTLTTTPTSPRGSPSMGFAAAATNRISALLSRKSTPNLKAMPSGHSQSYSTSNLLPTPPPSGGHQTSYSTSSLLTPKSPAKNMLYTPASTAPSTTEDLLEALTREQQLRLAAEAKVNETSREVEELSVSLFEEANEMVATERRERARLEERVGELEKRDRQKKVRLERLEGAVGRIERVRNLLEGKDADTQA
ncbi:hypothetical protein N0V93_006137 [Gnomoniopsis smithogilvyi]|uniref:GDP/GTP exchange factor Sec2 N-terminal domain-containing protein n=1 Tax=Gnomoniopsis smithogilvyi TaxID=1191159 RepID=A0A9W8YR43_9PEZI|nr:hypothetical protein N0V93_006137 [Gnomoniopsis smithogilvyi]